MDMDDQAVVTAAGKAILQPNAESTLTSHVALRKRRRENDDTDQAKAKKSALNAKPMQLKFTDLNIDCLEKIFEFLHFIDLLNIADLTTNTMEAARFVFSRRYSKFELKLCGHEILRSIEIRDSTITIGTASLCAKMLRSFGDVIKNLMLTNFSNVKLQGDWIGVKSLINQKCTQNVHSLQLENCDSQMFDDIESAFESVKSLKISCSRLGKCMDLKKWFPKLETLELLHSDRCVQIVSNFPHLSYLAMDINEECLSTANIKAMLESVPQLQTLSLSGGMKMSLLYFISECLPRLKRLYLWDFHLENESDDLIVFKSLKKLSVSTGLFGILPNKIPFKCEQLTELQVSADCLGVEWINFAMEQQNVTKLRLISILIPEITDDELGALAKKLVKLTEVDIIAAVSSSGLAHFLSDCKLLKKLRIKYFGLFNLSALSEMMDSSWNVTHSENELTFERKTTQ